VSKRDDEDVGKGACPRPFTENGTKTNSSKGQKMHRRSESLQAVTENLMADETTRDLLRAAELGDAEAQLRIAYRYELGAWYDDVAEEAVKWLERAAEQGHVGAQWELAVQCCPEFDRDLPPLRDDPATTLLWMRAAAEQGHADAIGRMAEIYERGLAGVAPDFDEATKWLLIGGPQCDYSPHRLLARLTQPACQISREHESFLLDVVRTDAENGHVCSQLVLGNAYAHGLIWLAADDVESVKWHSLAAGGGSFDETEIAVFRRNAEICGARLQRHLGEIFKKGENIHRDVSEAARWYELSAKQGDADAQFSIAFMYDQGQGVSQNDELAAMWYQKAAEQGDAAAQNNLGVMYDNGHGVEQNPREARRWYLAAARQGDDTASYNLGVNYLFGQGVRESAELAARWFRIASRNGSVWGSVALAAVSGAEADLIRAVETLFNEHGPDPLSEMSDCVAQVSEFRDRLAALIEHSPLPSGTAPWDSEIDEDSDRRIWWKKLSQAARVATTLQGMLWLVGNEQNEEEARACFDLAAKNGDPLAAYYLVKLDWRAGAYTHALKRLRPSWMDEFLSARNIPSEPQQVYSKGFHDSLEGAIREMSDNIRADKAKEELRQAKIKAAEESHKQTLSFLTHTLNNALSTGPETVRTVIEILGSDLYDQGQAGYKAINNMASLFPVFLFAESLLKTFKLYVSDPEQVREKWKSDHAGDATVSLVMAMALRQSVARFVFSPNHLAQLKRLLPGQDKEAIKNVRKSFVDEIIPLEVTLATVGKMFDWVKVHFGLLHVEIDPDAEMSFGSNATRYMFFFAAFSELIYNALKYSDGARPIAVRWFREGADYCFTCRNSFDAAASGKVSQDGTNKGLFFVDKLMFMLDGSALQYGHQDADFMASLRFGHDNFGESKG
jgi:TPR repeat protein